MAPLYETANRASSPRHTYSRSSPVRVHLIPFIYLISKVFSVKAKAVYSYTGGNSDELPFAEGDTLSIVDKSEGDWWKAEQGGVIFIVPAAYLELVEG